MYSGKIAVPPGGGELINRWPLINSIDRLKVEIEGFSHHPNELFIFLKYSKSGKCVKSTD
jgi:hypothetical protein